MSKNLSATASAWQETLPIDAHVQQYKFIAWKQLVYFLWRLGESYITRADCASVVQETRANLSSSCCHLAMGMLSSQMHIFSEYTS